MTSTLLYIKNMCCNRCIMAVRKLLKDAGYNPVSVLIGEAVFAKSLSQKDLEQIREKLQDHDFDIAENNDDKIVVKIHALLCKYLDEVDDKNLIPQKLSAYLKEKMHRSYYYISRGFSSVTGVSIEKYYMQLKIEKAKKLITNKELSLKEIAWQLGYNSQQTFSTQFKKETGKTPSEYKINPVPARVHLDKLIPQNFKQHRHNIKQLAD